MSAEPLLPETPLSSSATIDKIRLRKEDLAAIREGGLFWRQYLERRGAFVVREAGRDGPPGPPDFSGETLTDLGLVGRSPRGCAVRPGPFWTAPTSRGRDSRVPACATRPCAGRVCPRAQLSGADLTEASLIDADLSGASLESARMTGAISSGTDLTQAVLQGAALPPDLSSATLAGADLAGARSVGVALPFRPAGGRLDRR